VKKTQIIDLIKNIKGSFVSFFSIMLFVTLGVGVFLGMSWGGRGLALTISKTQEDNNFRDLEIISPYGFTKDDVERLRKVEGVATIEGTYNSYAYFYHGDEKLQAKICTLPKDINTLYSFDGTMPSKPNEIIVEKHWANEKNISIGDSITFLHDANEHPHALSLLLENEDRINDVETLLKLFEEDPADPDGMQTLNYDTYTVTGVGESPEYISLLTETYGTSATLSTPVDIVMFFPEEAFDEKSYTGYTNILVKSDHLKGAFIDKEFRDENDRLRDKLNETVKELTAAKNKKVIEIADKLKSVVDNAPKQVEEAQRQIDSGKKEIEINEHLVNEGDKQINSGRAMLEAGRDMLLRARSELESRLGQFDQYFEKIEGLAANASGLADKLDTIYNAKTTQDVIEFIKKHADDASIDGIKGGIAILAAMYSLANDQYTADVLLDIVNTISQLQEETRDVRTGDKKVLDAKVEALKRKIPYYAEQLRSIATFKRNVEDRIDEYVEEVEERLNESMAEVEANEAQVNNSQAQLNSGRQQINEGKKQIEDYQAQLDKMKGLLEGSTARQLSVAASELKDYSSAVLTKYNNPTSALATTLVEIFYGIRFSLAALFFIVGILVCYSALSRLIFSHIRLLGTKKALGLMKREITLSYLLYGGLAVLLGCVLGIALGYFILQPVIIIILSSSFAFTGMVFYSQMNEAWIICALEIVFILLTTFVACRSLLREHPVTLLAGPQPPGGKHRFFEKYALWKRLSLFSKTMVNNLMMDKRRVVGTLIGIMGCTALLVAGITIKLNADKSSEIQNSELTKFDGVVLFNGREEGCKDRIKKVLDDNNISSASFLMNSIRIVLPDGREDISKIYTSDQENFTDFFRIRNNKGRFKQMADGVMVSNGYLATFDVDPGDKVEFIDNTGQHFFIPYVGELENYNPSINVVMPSDTYEKYTKEKYVANSFTIVTNGVDMDKLKEELEKVPGYITLHDYASANKGNFKTIARATLVISGVAVALATVMAFLVILNLLVMQVEEKKREMIILMINGYSLKDAKKYIYKDTIFLTAIGIVLGCLLGDFIGNWNMKVLSVMPAHFYEGTNWIAIGAGVVVAAFLAFINALIAMRRIKYFKLTDINK